jgi:hypothetical protein
MFKWNIEDIFLSVSWLEISIFFEPEKWLFHCSLSNEEKKQHVFCVVFVLVLVCALRT